MAARSAGVEGNLMENEALQASQKKLYVGSLPYSWTTEQLEELFTPYGRVTSAAIVSDQATRKSKGFGFIELESEEAAKKAMSELNGKEIEGRLLAVREARPHVERSADRNANNNSQGNYRNQFAQQSEESETDTSGRSYGNRRGWW